MSVTETAELEHVGYVDAAQVAKWVRKYLKDAFGEQYKGLKFSVRTDKYSMGASINVRWTDGPTAKEVDDVIGGFAGGNFNGMIDLYEHSASVATIDGETFAFSSGAHYIFTNRDLSAEAKLTLAKTNAHAASASQCQVCFSLFDTGLYAEHARAVTCSVDCFARAEASEANLSADGKRIVSWNREVSVW